jgi:malonyl CoA-acyl carrier protein transacylase
MIEKNRFQQYLEKQKEKAESEGKKDVKPWDLLNPNTEYVDTEISSERFNICKVCPELFQMTKQCKKCGCFMALKSKLKNASCPIGKW